MIAFPPLIQGLWPKQSRLEKRLGSTGNFSDRSRASRNCGTAISSERVPLITHTRFFSWIGSTANCFPGSRSQSEKVVARLTDK